MKTLTPSQIQGLVHLIATTKFLNRGRVSDLQTHPENCPVPHRTMIALIRKGAITFHPYRFEGDEKVYEERWESDPFGRQPIEARLASWAHDLIDVEAIPAKYVSYSMRKKIGTFKRERVWNYDAKPYIFDDAKTGMSA